MIGAARPAAGHRVPAARGMRGQATVELALCLPIVVLVLLLVIQVALVGRSAVLVAHAAREGARAAALGPNLDDVGRAVRASPGLDAARLRWARGPRVPDQLVRVTVRYRVPTRVPLVGRLLGDPEVSATVAMRAEPDGTG